MLRSFLIGLVAGQRGITPLAVLATATRRGEVAPELPLQRLMLDPVIAAGTAVFAAAEMSGDKIKTAPDRTVPIGLVVRSVTAAYAGAALAPRDKRLVGAGIAVTAAIASAYPGLALRKWAMKRYGQPVTGFIEEAIVFASRLAITNPGLFTANAEAASAARQARASKWPSAYGNTHRDDRRLEGGGHRHVEFRWQSGS